MAPTGKYVMESYSNLGPFMAACGTPEALIRKALNPANITTLTIFENEDGSITNKQTFSLAPELDHSYTFKVGETFRLAEPIGYEVTCTTKGDNCWTFRDKNLANGNVIEEVLTFHNYGLSFTGCLENKDISFKEEFKKVSGPETGYFVLESETGMADFMRVAYPNLDLALVDEIKKDSSLRLTEKNGVLSITEYRAGNTKTYSIRMGEEFKGCDPGWMDETRVMTRTAPGELKMVQKSMEGVVINATLNFSEWGITEVVESGGVSCTLKFRRMPDIEGTWKAASISGLEGYLEALGIPKSMLSEMDAECRAPKTLERLDTRKVKITSKSKLYPDEVVLNMAEEVFLELPTLGKMKMIQTENGNEILTVIKHGGHTISAKDKVSGDFSIQESCVDDCPKSTMKVIKVRQ